MGKGEISSTEYFSFFHHVCQSVIPSFPQTFLFCISMNRMAIIMYANLQKKKLHVDNEGCVMNLRYMYIGYVHFLNRIQN